MTFAAGDAPTGRTERFERAIAAIDQANAQDPNVITGPDGAGPKELVHARMMTAWIERLVHDPSEALLLAARAHHIRRWEVPRSTYPEGRGGYLRWRTDLHQFHAGHAADILASTGYEPAIIDRVSELLHKRGLGREPEVQALEDALSLVFLETQFADLSARTDREKMVNILRRTWRKMSAGGHAAALRLAGGLNPNEVALIEAALAEPK